MKALPAPPSYPLLPEGKPENIMDNPYVIEFIERLLKQPYGIGEERQDGSPAEIHAPFFIDHVRMEIIQAAPFFVIDRFWIKDNKGQIEAVKMSRPIPLKKRTWMNLDSHERK